MQQKSSKNKGSDPQDNNDVRLIKANAWVGEKLGIDRVNLRPVSGDASFRRYFRLQSKQRSYILMDAPPEQENSRPFVDIAGRLRAAGLCAPRIHHFDYEQGFGLLQDFGDLLYREVLTPENVDTYFPDLFHALKGLATRVDCTGLPEYDNELLQTELDLFTDWYLLKHCKHKLNARENELWHALCKTLRSSALAQPQVFVHRDFHSCNLLFQAGQDPAIIDFQDGVSGPLSYDLVSLLWDRYVRWPRSRLESWMRDFHKLLQLDTDPAEWQRWCDFMGLQRNLKIVGIFARLHYRDEKAGYLEMIPNFYQYLLDVLPLYPELEEFQRILQGQKCAP
jgi:aminoglycoside/choline kinase family phosphotransferase